MNNFSKDNFGLIKFGEESWLKNIKEGEIWFRTLEYYRRHETSDNIGDKHEGVTEIIHPDKDTELLYYPSLNDKTPMDLSGLKKPIYMSPRYNKQVFIFCLSYITHGDITNKIQFDNSILSDKKWGAIFYFLEPEKFKFLIMDTLKNYNPKIGKVQYHDFSKNQENLCCFSKSNVYLHQKEVRIVITYSGEPDKKIIRIDDETIEVSLDSEIEGVISPTKTFVEIMNKRISGSYQG